jgi:ParB/RepB/Spo0J family partition protein
MNQVTESILVEDVDFDSSQPRQTIKKLPELKDDIKLRGQIYPVVVTPYADREGRRYWGADATKFKYRYWLIDGERRMKALKELGYEKVNATIQLESDEMKLYEMQFVTNSKREDVNPVDMAKALQRYLRLFESNKCEGSPMKKIATLTGFSTSYLASRLIILKAPKWCVSGIYTGKLGATIPAEIGRSIPIKWQSSVYESVKAGAIKNVLDVRVISKKIKMIYEEYPENIEQADEMIKSTILNPAFLALIKNSLLIKAPLSASSLGIVSTTFLLTSLNPQSMSVTLRPKRIKTISSHILEVIMANLETFLEI